MPAQIKLEHLATCIEIGKVSRHSIYPPEEQGKPGVEDLLQDLLGAGIAPGLILERGLMPGMRRIGDRYSEGKAFVPQLLLAARAMTAAMGKLKPYFDSGEAAYRGHFVIGTVQGDLHDIGKNIVRMILEGNGWHVIDLGVDVSAETFLEALEKHPGSFAGMSALLTTTMVNMEAIVRQIKKQQPETKVFVGGAPLSDEFSARIGADGFFQDPQRFVQHLEALTGPARKEGCS